MTNSEEQTQQEVSVFSSEENAETANLQTQAAQLEILLPRLMRRLFMSEPHQPAGELTLAQMRVCTLLQDGTHSLSSVARELGISTSAATQIADRLERLGLVERIAQSEDRRAKHLLLTPHGEDVMHSRRKRRIERLQTILDQVAPEQRADLIMAIEGLLDAARLFPVPPESENGENEADFR